MSLLGMFGLGLGAAILGNATEGAMNYGYQAATGAQQWAYTKKQLELEQKYALERMQKQAEYQRAAFDYENAYNDPSKVFARYRMAGVNPAAVLGSSGASLSATMPMPSAVGSGSVSGGFNLPHTPPLTGDLALNASQIGLNLARIEEANSNTNLNEEKAVTESSVRALLGASVTEKEQNAYFLSQKSIAQEIVNSHTDELLNTQIGNLKASTDNLLASANLSEEQVSLVKAQTAKTFIDSCLSIEHISLVKAQTDAQKELAKLYKEERGFISLKHEDLEANIKSLKATQRFTTYRMMPDGSIKPTTWKLNGYGAKGLILQLESMSAMARSASESVQADWENPNQWNRSIDTYWDNILQTAGVVGSFLGRAALAPGTMVTEKYNGDGEFVGGSRSYRVPYSPR